ncbi:MAG TPA: nucleotide exchange factor GrpE [Thermoanaerobaculia bacterium]|nr:nucleotide exchange factor GrpE [Thermoanaerobaculia bacterium]
MTSPLEPPDDDVVFLEDDGRDEVAKALEDAERAVEAVEERHRKTSGEHRVPRIGVESDSVRVAELERGVLQERERAVKAEEDAGRVREALLRKTADFENLKRRSEKEKTDFFKFALAETFRDLLGVLDNFERALAHGAEGMSGADMQAGIDMIAKQLADTLRRYGLVEIPAEGLTFDPTVHEAIAREETTEAPPGTILEVFQKGYVLNDRLLRPARVKVAAAPPEAKSGGNGE